MKAASVVAQSVAERLATAIGVDSGSVDAGRLQWIINERCRQLNLADTELYPAFLQQNDEELDALIEDVIIPETRFFRDPGVFEHIRIALPKLATDFPGVLRILSAPSGAGQEAYSLGATLLQMGYPAARFSIDAFDISQKALTTARRAIFPEQALRHLTSEQQRLCAAPHLGHWKIHEELRQRVNFERRNLAEPDALAAAGGGPQYHLILCRNLFIYLRPQARAALAASLAEALVPGGRLIVGTADRVEELIASFAPLRPAASFAFAHRGLPVAASAPPPRRIDIAELPPPPANSIALKPAATIAASTTAAELLTNALFHQQNGNLRKAERRCRQSLYLAPDYLPALELLDVLWQNQPNQRLRRALGDRILRVRAGLELQDPMPGTAIARSSEQKESA